MALISDRAADNRSGGVLMVVDYLKVRTDITTILGEHYRQDEDYESAFDKDGAVLAVMAYLEPLLNPMPPPRIPGLHPTSHEYDDGLTDRVANG